MSALRAGAILVIATTLFVTSGCLPGSRDPTGLGIASGGIGGGAASNRLAFLVQPNSVSAGSAITPEVKVIAVDSLGRVLGALNGAVSVTLGSGSGGTLSGTTSVTASGGLAIFPSLVISQAGTGYTLIASAPGLVSVSSAPFTVF